MKFSYKFIFFCVVFFTMEKYADSLENNTHLLLTYPSNHFSQPPIPIVQEAMANQNNHNDYIERYNGLMGRSGVTQGGWTQSHNPNPNLTYKKHVTNRYLGCYNDNPLQRMFTGFASNLDMGCNNNNCINFCKRRRYVYAGTQFGYMCYCGNTAPQPPYHRVLPQYECNIACKGNSMETCGGFNKMSVYETGIEQKLFDEYGSELSESDSMSEIPFVMKMNCE